MSEPVVSEPVPEPTPEQFAERARRADKATRSVLAALLGLEALTILLVPRAIAFTTGLGPVRLTIVITLAVVLVVAAGLVRRSWGIALGSALQLAFFATGVLIATMFFIAALFIAVWLRVLMFRQEVIGGRGGIRILAG
ncbi:MAG: hypothetical protein QOG01_957 [Pseudonocardiales bacterium]|nr:hypothetical protein [Pseudonocardiales bacterium]